MPHKIIPYNPKLKARARELRNNSTLGEILLWQEIKNKSLGAEFHRQVPIDNYIVDSFCHELFLAIEVDGNSHDFADISRSPRKKTIYNWLLNEHIHWYRIKTIHCG